MLWLRRPSREAPPGEGKHLIKKSVEDQVKSSASKMEETNVLNTQLLKEAKRAAAKERERASRKRINQDPERREAAFKKARSYRNSRYSQKDSGEPARKKWDSKYQAKIRQASPGKIRQEYTPWSTRPKEQQEAIIKKKRKVTPRKHESY